MQDRLAIIRKISKNKKFKINILKPFNKIVVDFLNDVSKALRKKKEINLYPDLVYLMFWCRKTKIENLSKNFIDNKLRLGRGLIFHICPSNMPTNFIYSFFFGLLSGNSNIIKVPSKKFKENEILLTLIKSLFRKKKYIKLKDSNFFIQYNNEIDITKKISSACDGRMIWGGDNTINELRKIWIPERAVELTFSDRYSLSIINVDKLTKLKKNDINLIVKKFYYDSYTMNQNACNSPHFVFWIGKKNNKIQNYFWNQLKNVVEKNFLFDDIHIIDKYSNLLTNIINHKDFKKIKRYKNFLYVIEANKKIDSIENIRGINGTFFQINIKKINNLSKFITKKCQTVSYFGFSKNELDFFLSNNNLLGIDRMIPIGKALDIDIIWDGYDVIRSLSRIITTE